MDPGAPAMPNALIFGLVAIAIGALLFALYSAIRAWSLSFGHPAFDNLGMRKWFMGIAVVPYMPLPARAYITQYLVGFAVFIVAIVGFALTIAFSVTSEPAPLPS